MPLAERDRDISVLKEINARIVVSPQARIQFDPARIRQVGLMIAARQAGPFTLHIKRISLA